MTNTSVFPSVAIVGMGLIGSSLLRRCAVFGGLARKVIGIDRTESVCRRIEELNLADVVSQNTQAVKEADCVVLCVPVGAMGDVARAVIPHMKAGSILSDTGSTKCTVIKAIAQPLATRPDIAYVPAHPMAGTEFSGPDAGLADLFEGAWCLLTPIAQSSATAVSKIEQFWHVCGAYVKSMSPQHHDDICSKVSHLPHFVSFTICQMVCGFTEQRQQEIIDYSASGFQDFTRIAGSDAIMWRDIFLSNRESLLKTLDEFQESFAQLRQALKAGDGPAIVGAVKKGNDLRARLVQKNK